MAYALKYKVEFSEFQLNISQKNYAGAITTVEAGSPAVLHRWDKDEPTAPIKGSSLTANVIGLPLFDLYSEDDNEFKGELYKESNLLFSGFLVQDDCTEPVDDLDHVSQLSFTDNLGLLKDVSFGEALAALLTETTEVHINASGTAIDITGLTLAAGDVFTIVGIGNYTIDTVVDSDSYTTTTALPTLSGFYNLATEKVLTDSKISLFAVIQACLKATDVQIPLEIFSNLSEDAMTGNSSFFEQTLIARETFLKSEREYDDCYSVLEKVMSDLKATLVQSEGQWNIVRWFEQKPATLSYQYDMYFRRLGSGAYSNFKAFGKDEGVFPEYGYEKRLVRPFKKVKETFKYQSLFNLIKNADLKDLGPLIRQYVVNEEDYKPDDDINSTNEYTVTYKEYQAPSWTANNIGTPNEVYIRVIEDELHYEIERYLVIEKNVTEISNPIAVFAEPIEISQNDVIEFSFQFRTSVNNTQDSPDIDFAAFLTYGAFTTPSNNQVDLTTVPCPPNYQLTWHGWGSGDAYGGTTNGANNVWKNVDVSKWQTVSIKSRPAPVDGQLYLFLADLAGSTFLPDGAETHYTDFSFKILYSINESTNIAGHTHTNGQASNTKNNDETDITIDDSPRNTIAGTLFLPIPSSSGQKTRTKSWSLPSLTAVQSCKLFHFQVFGPSDPYTITGQYCDGSPINISGMGSGGNPAPICGRPGTIVTTGCEIVNQSDDCGTYTPDATPRRLGEITTREIKQWRSKSRLITEGTLHGNTVDDIIVSPMTSFNSPIFPGVSFVPGVLEIDYANRTCTGTLNELYQTGEAAVTSVYNFEYTFDNK